MSDLSLEYGNDLDIAPDGDFAIADGDVELRQDIVRALATNAREVLDDGTILDAEYLFHQDYGASLGRRVGRTVSRGGTGPDQGAIENSVRRALGTVPGVSKTQPPAIKSSVVSGGVRLLIAPTSAATNKPVAQINLFIPT